MKTLLLIISLLLIVLGILASCVVLISMGISSRDLWEFRNELEKKTKNRIKNDMDTKTLEKLQRIYDKVDSFGKDLMEKEFPELKESDDEKIRKEILNCFVEMKKQGCFPSKHTEQYDSWISWLEKQGKENTELPNGEDYGIDGLYHALQILQATLGNVAGYQSDDGILEHKCAISVVKKLYEQILWGEDDENTMNQIIGCLRGQIDSDLPKMTNWIKSVKQRLTIQY